MTDEDCDCVDNDTQPCYTGAQNTQNVGECSDGTQTCVNGEWAPCVGDTTPTQELCNGLDDDCNGTPDNGNPGGGGSCDTMLLGVCAAGAYQCNNGNLECQQIVMSSPEQCNGLDDNCDGTPDEGNPGGGGMLQRRGSPAFAPRAPSSTARWAASLCMRRRTTCRRTEQCNNLDDDCDGRDRRG